MWRLLIASLLYANLSPAQRKEADGWIAEMFLLFCIVFALAVGIGLYILTGMKPG
jgi:hypothetical protein